MPSRFACVVAAASLLTIAACKSSSKDAATAAAGPPPREASFDVRHEVKIAVPEGAKAVRAWVAYPQDDPLQTVADLKVECPYPHRVITDDHGNRMLYVEANAPTTREFSVVETFRLVRREQKVEADPSKTRPLTDAEKATFAAELAPNTHVVIDDSVRKVAREATGGEKNPVLAARRLYDWELRNVDYWVKDPDNRKASPVGSTEYTLKNRTGNCTDFHSLWTSMARAEGIPTRMVYGSFLKKDLDGKDKDQSYHCWPEFYAPGIGWVPHDVAVADIFVGDFQLTPTNEEKVRLTTADGYSGADPAKVDYYFGAVDERRVTWSRGRDLKPNPAPAAGALNHMAKAHVEVDGQVLPENKGWTRKLTFTTPAAR
ncbi:MAG TPA: transglutaminase domain-containing protein [Planctomycetota bacterium]|nr:transglutaminase domain-containing protein [Planctomycetota bacterium]